MRRQRSPFRRPSEHASPSTTEGSRHNRPGTASRFFKVAAARRVLTFKPCSRAKTPTGWTGFAGGFIVKGAQCARVNAPGSTSPECTANCTPRSRSGRAAASPSCSGVTHQGGLARQHLDAYLDEFVFRFNRRAARNRGLVFYRLLEQCLRTRPLNGSDLVMSRRGQRGARRGPAPKPKGEARRSSP